MYKRSTRLEVKDWIKEQIPSSMDILFHELKGHEKKVELVFIKSITDDQKIHETIIKPFYEMGTKDGFEGYLESLPNYSSFQDKEQLLQQILMGSLAIFWGNKIYIFDVKKIVDTGPFDAMVESTILGPQKSLGEDVVTNLNMIRHRYHHKTLKADKIQVGTISGTLAAVVYDEKFVDQEVLAKVKDKLSKVSLDVVTASGQLTKYFQDNKYPIFPTVMMTERPDRIIFNLAQGKIAVLLQGTPFCLIVPAVFYDFISSMEDFYNTFWVNRFLVTLRYIGLFLSLTLPSFYVALTSYNPEIFRIQLSLSIAGSRASVPYPSYVEVMFMLLMIELLMEASIRLPKAIGSTATTVGGLILGQAATQAGLISNIMIIVVAAMAISNFVVPINVMSFAFRTAKYFLLLLSIIFGILGIVIGLIGILAYLVNLDSMGRPFLKLYFEKPKQAKQTERVGKGSV